ncbi:Acg family FMN-binding oxidoreductase [Paenibacillus macerans]|uniref:Acg family FMN-binding oxidoreductase n=1 Tax=Paenibacillus macerans TaxID=44252 RepID=UPI003D30F56C
MKRKRVKTRVIIAIAGIAMTLIAAFIALLLISGIFTSPQYLEPWQKNYSESFEDPRIRLAAHGLLAANGHNMQPWKIKLDGNDPMAFDLYADNERLPDKVDPLARQMMVTHGTFLEYVRIAGQRWGYRVDIQLFPQGEYDERNLLASMAAKPVARIELERTAPRAEPLYDFLFLPDTNRGAYESGQLTAEEIKSLENVNTDARGISVTIYQDTENVEKLGGYAMKAAAVEAGVNRVMAESEVIFRANEREKNKYCYGFSVEGQGSSGIMRHLMQGLVTLFPSMNTGKAAADTFMKSAAKSVDSTSAYAMIVTSDNTRTSQVESGMAYSKLILEAHRLGLALQPLSQALEEYPEMQELYQGIHREYAHEGGTIQMLVRVGRPTREAPLSMRRDVMDLIAED